MKKRISVIQIGHQPPQGSLTRDWFASDPEHYSSPDRPKFLVDYEYSQGHLSWEATDDPLKALDLHTFRAADNAITHFISGISKSDRPDLQGKIRTFVIEVTEVPSDIILILCPVCNSHLSVEEKANGSYGKCTGYKCPLSKPAEGVIIKPT